eukprot:28875_2
MSFSTFWTWRGRARSTITCFPSSRVSFVGPRYLAPFGTLLVPLTSGASPGARVVAGPPPGAIFGLSKSPATEPPPLPPPPPPPPGSAYPPPYMSGGPPNPPTRGGGAIPPMGDGPPYPPRGYIGAPPGEPIGA